MKKSIEHPKSRRASTLATWTVVALAPLFGFAACDDDVGDEIQDVGEEIGDEVEDIGD